MNAGLTRRDLLARFVRPLQSTKPAATSVAAAEQVAIIQGRHCLALTSFCAACVERCPVSGAMQVVNGMPMVVADVCTGCGICQEICPAPTNAVMLRPRRAKVQPRLVLSHES
jgi:Na+-translocating ferredoxin:NAD+ oxidoreductase RNF subunit RnfB